MALHTAQLSSSQLTGATSTQISGLTCIQLSLASPPTAADFAAYNNAIVNDQAIVSSTLGPAATAIQAGLEFTATLSDTDVAMTSVAFVSPTGAVIGMVQPNMYVIGPGLQPGTRVLTATGTTITLDRNSIKGSAGFPNAPTYCVVAPPQSGYGYAGGVNGGILFTPRGQLQCGPGDVLALDTLGQPYLIPAISVSFNGGGKNTSAPWLFV